MSSAPTTLFSPIRIGDIDCANRIFMAPLTRCRATPGGDVPNALMAEYYAQRAGAGLIVSEGTQVLANGKGYMNTPGIYSAEQESGWRLVTNAVHQRGGRIVAQLWHVGAISHPDLQPDGAQPVTATEGFNPGGITRTPRGKVERGPARALSTDEVRSMVGAFRHAAEVARRAGFDGAEIHGANGYLIEQFLRDSSNQRSDAYGGSIDTRIRFALEVVDAVAEVFGASRTGIRLSPVTLANNAKPDSNAQATYGALVEALAARGIAYVHFIEGNTGGARDLTGFDFAWAKKRLGEAGVTYIANNRYDRILAMHTIAHGAADAIAFGVSFLANPDLPERLRRDAPLNPPRPKLFYAPGAEGYTDYPAL